MINDFKVASKSLLELLFPTFCVGCKSYGELICDQCYENIHFNENLYYNCGGMQILCPTDYEQRIIFKIITSFKYGLIKNLDLYCAKIIRDFLEMHNFEFKETGIISFVPMHHRKQTLRGFNQTELIANRLSALLSLPCRPTLEKTRHTKAQMLLDRKERLSNLMNSFTATDCEGKDILLIDDVVTTGSTLRECRNTLLAAGANSVTCLAFCKD